MSPSHVADRAGILPRVGEILEAATDATDQITTGAAQIRAYRVFVDRQKRHKAERRFRR